MPTNAMMAAKEYVDKQLAVMEKYGSKTELSATEYDALVQKVHDVTILLRRRAQKRRKGAPDAD